MMANKEFFKDGLSNAGIYYHERLTLYLLVFLQITFVNSLDTDQA